MAAVTESNIADIIGDIWFAQMGYAPKHVFCFHQFPNHKIHAVEKCSSCEIVAAFRC